MRVVLLGVLVCLGLAQAKPYNRYASQRESRFTVHEKPPELVVNAGPEGVKVQAKPSKLQVIEYPHRRSVGAGWGGGYGGNGCGVISHEGAALGGDGCGNRGEGGWLSSGHENWMHAGGGTGFGAGFGGGFGGGHHEHTTYVPSHTPPVHVGPNAPPIHVGPHVPAVHVGPHVPSIHYGTHAPLYHVGPHVPFVHMPPPVTTVHAGPMGPPVHVSSPPTVYHQPPVVYHQPHVVGHATDHGFGHGYGVGGYYGGNTGYGASHYGGHDDECCGETGRARGYGGYGRGYGGGVGGYAGRVGGGYGGYARGYGRSNIPKESPRKQKRSIQGEFDESSSTDVTTRRNKRQMPYYGWHPFPASVHVGPHTPPIHIGPHYPPVHIGPHVPAVHIGPHVPYINIPAHVPAIHVRPHVPAVHISPPVPIINAGNHVPAVHVTSPPTVYHRPPIVIHQPHIVHSPNRANGAGHEIYGQEARDGGLPGGVRDATGFIRPGAGSIAMPHDGGFGGGFNGQSFNGAIGKRTEIPSGYYSELDEPNPGKLSLRNLYSMVRPRRQLLGGSSDGGDSVIFVHPSGSSSPVGGSITGDSPLAGLESPSLPGAASSPSHASLGASSQMESPSLPGTTGNAFAKSGLSGLSSLTNNLASPDSSFPALSSHALSGLSNLATPSLPHDFGNMGAGLNSLNNNLESSNGLSGALPESMSASMNMPSSQTQHDDSFSADTPNMNIGGIQGGFNEDSSHSTEESSSLNNFQRSLFPSASFARYIDADRTRAEQSDSINIDSSTERDAKSFIPHEEEDEDRHERVHKDIIPRPEGLGY